MSICRGAFEGLYSLGAVALNLHDTDCFEFARGIDVIFQRHESGHLDCFTHVARIRMH